MKKGKTSGTVENGFSLGEKEIAEFTQVIQAAMAHKEEESCKADLIRDNQELRKQVEDHTKTIANLQDVIEFLRSNKESFASNQEDVQRQLTQTLLELENERRERVTDKVIFEQQVKKVERECERKLAEKQQELDQLSEFISEKLKIEEELRRLTRENATMKCKNREVIESIASGYENKFEELEREKKRQVDALESSIQGRLDQARAEGAIKASEDNNQLQQEVQILTNQVHKLLSKIESLEKEKLALSLRINMVGDMEVNLAREKARYQHMIKHATEIRQEQKKANLVRSERFGADQDTHHQADRVHNVKPPSIYKDAAKKRLPPSPRKSPRHSMQERQDQFRQRFFP